VKSRTNIQQRYSAFYGSKIIRVYFKHYREIKERTPEQLTQVTCVQNLTINT